MSDSTAPRAVAVILEALGANTEFSDAIIGDLAEEYEQRAGWDGRASARRWYYRESVRVAPYLLRDWWRGLRRNDIATFANAMLWSALTVLTLEVILALAVRALLPLDAFGMSVILALAMLPWTLIDGAVGGYVAAWLGRRTPLPIAISVGIMGSLMILLDAKGTAIPWWFRVANATTLMAGVLLGAMVRVWREARREIAAPVE